MINGHSINGAVINGASHLETAPPPITALHFSPWSAPLAAVHHAQYQPSLARVHASPYSLLAPVGSLHAAAYYLAPYDALSVSFELPAPFGAEVAWTFDYSLLAPLDVAFDLLAPLRTEVSAAWTLDCGMTAAGTVERTWTMIYSLLDEAPLIVTDEIVALKDGQVIELADETDMSLDEGSPTWRGRLVLAHTSDGALFQFDDPLVVSFCGIDFQVVVDTKQVLRNGPADTRVIIGVIGAPAPITAPRAPRFDREWDEPVSAKAVVEELVGAVEWRINDWIIPAHRLGAEGATAFDVVSRILEATGAVLESYPNGALYARYLFEVPLLQFQQSTPDHVFLDADHLFSLEEQNQYFELADRFRVTDLEEATFGDRIEFEPNEDSGLSGELHVYPSPWRDVELAHTGPASVGLSGGADQVQEKTEQIQILNGSGNLRYPVLTIESIEWQAVNLGGLAFTSGSTTVESTHPALSETLCTITYTTRAKVYQTSAPVELDVQFVLRSAA